MAIEVFNRCEYKYLLDHKTYEAILPEMYQHMLADPYNEGGNPYTIANIYYDTPDDYLIRHSLSKPPYKEKLRLRAYGVPDAQSVVFLEIKKKYNGIVNKRRTALTLAEAYSFTMADRRPPHRPHMNRQVMNEIEYFLSIYPVEPKLYLAYDRIAFFEKDNADLRISFDSAIRSRRYDVALEKGDYGAPLLPNGCHLMEIKTSRAMPLWLSTLLSELSLRRSSFSKYGTEYRQQLADDKIKIAI